MQKNKFFILGCIYNGRYRFPKRSFQVYPPVKTTSVQDYKVPISSKYQLLNTKGQPLISKRKSLPKKSLSLFMSLVIIYYLQHLSHYLKQQSLFTEGQPLFK